MVTLCVVDHPFLVSKLLSKKFSLTVISSEWNWYLIFKYIYIMISCTHDYSRIKLLQYLTRPYPYHSCWCMFLHFVYCYCKCNYKMTWYKYATIHGSYRMFVATKRLLHGHTIGQGSSSMDFRVRNSTSYLQFEPQIGPSSWWWLLPRERDFLV